MKTIYTAVAVVSDGGHRIQSFNDLYTELKCITHLYEKLGQQLDIPANAMKFASSSKSLQDCASDMLSTWLDQDPQPSWRTLINAINKAPDLVTELRRKYKGNSTKIVIIRKHTYSYTSIYQKSVTNNNINV